MVCNGQDWRRPRATRAYPAGSVSLMCVKDVKHLCMNIYFGPRRDPWAPCEKAGQICRVLSRSVRTSSDTPQGREVASA